MYPIGDHVSKVDATISRFGEPTEIMRCRGLSSNRAPQWS